MPVSHHSSVRITAKTQPGLKELNIQSVGGYKHPLKLFSPNLNSFAGCEVLPGCRPPVPIRAHPVAGRPGMGMQVKEAAHRNRGENTARGGGPKTDP